MADLAHPVGAKVRVNEGPDPRNGMEGVVTERMDDGVKTRFRTLVRFERDRRFTGLTRWYADANLEAVDGDEGS